MFKEITTQPQFDILVKQLAESARYSLDTEFHREKTYFPQLALLQIRVDNQTYLIDPLEVSLKPLKLVFESKALCVMHAGSQDLEILQLEVGASPRNFMDTQIMAGFIGFSSPSLSLLHEKFMDMSLAKGDRLTDWLQRPLSDRQKAYAASDVDNLLEIYDLISRELEAKDRFDWAHEECQVLLAKYKDGIVRKEPISRIKEAKRLKGAKRAIAVNLANWREEQAAARNIPVRQVISDLAITAIAQKAPTNEKALLNIRGVEKRHISGDKATQIIQAVNAMPPEALDEPEAKRPELSKSLKPAVTLVNAWLAQLARNNDIDATLLATRADLESFLRKEPESRLAQGWRYKMAGEGIESLIQGSACISFDSESGLLIEPRKT